MTSTTKHIPGKRLKTWHRHAGKPTSLRRFARILIDTATSDSRSKMEHETALKWAGGKVAP